MSMYTNQSQSMGTDNSGSVQKQPLEIIHCAETIRGGITTYLRELVPLQAEAYGRSAIRLVVPESQATDVSDLVETVPFRDGGRRLSSSMRLMFKVVAEIKRRKPSVIHIHSTFAGMFVRPVVAIFFPKITVVYCAHGWAWDRPDGRLAKTVVVAVERVLLRITDAVVCISRHDYEAALAAKLEAKRLRVVLNGLSSKAPVSDRADSVWPPGVLRVLYVGRFDHQKGFDVLLNAARMLRRPISIVMAGAPVLGDARYIDLLEERDPKVILVGWQSPEGLACLFGSADVVVIPSRWEGFGLVALEAMRAGVAVVASRVGGLTEVVADGVTGVLVEPGSAKDLAAVLDCGDFDWRAMGERGLERFKKCFDITRTFEGLDEIYMSTQRIDSR